MPTLIDLLPDLTARLTGPLLPPPAPLPLIPFLRTLQVTEGDYQGSFDPGWHPGQRALIDLIAAGHRRILFHKPAQDGGSTTVAGLIIHLLTQLRLTVVYATTDKILARKLYAAKIKPMMIASGLGHHLPDEGAGSGTGFTDDLILTNGNHLYILGAGAANGAGQAGVTAGVVVIDEVDKLRPAQRRFLHSRVKSAANPLIIEFGTVDRDSDDGCEAEWQRTSAGRIHYPCPVCNTWQPLNRERLAWNDDDAESTVVYRCLACPAEITESQRMAMLPRGLAVHHGQSIVNNAVTGTITRGIPIGLKWNGLDSPIRKMPLLAAELNAAQRKHRDTGNAHDLRQIIHDDFCERYRDHDQVLRLRETDLAARSSIAGLTRGEYPADAAVITIGQDVQLRSHYWLSLAYSPTDGRWWIVDYGRKAVCGDGDEPIEPQRTAVLDSIAERGAVGWTDADGSSHAALAVGVDTGDGNTRAHLLPWLLNHGEPYYAVKGLGSRTTADNAGGTATERLPGVLAVYRQPAQFGLPEWDQISVAVDELKAEILRALTRKPGEPGSGHLPAGEAADGYLIRALCAERLEETDKGPRWILAHRFNHYLDCAVYALALAKWKSAWLSSGGDQSPVLVTGGRW
jgi:phage terminase large subunit GpA-like protein